MGDAWGSTESLGDDSVNVLLTTTGGNDGTERACTGLFRAADATRGVVVAIEQSVEDWLATHRDRGGLPDEMVVVSVGEDARSTTTAQPGGQTAPSPEQREEPVIDFVPAGDLSALGTTINSYLTESPESETAEPTGTVLCLDSVSALVDVSDVQTAFRFLHILTSLVRTRGTTAHYHLDPSQIDAATVATLAALFEAQLES